ncbi:MAG: nucleotidyltransferase substrate binding protein [Magnetococcus sp. MYC-9]
MNNKTLDLSSLRSAVTSLEDGLEVVSDSEWFNRQSSKVQNTLVAGVIQNFEFVYELSIKMIKRQIEIESASPNEVDGTNFREVLRVAAEKGMIADVEAWFQYRKMRNVSSHTYDHDKARRVCQETLTFISDARSLLNRLESRNG